MLLKYYLEQLDYQNIPDFLIKYLQTPSLVRLKNVGYFCGMDYASKSVYNFSEYISRYDHSLTVALITYKLTKDKKATLAALFHDISTPCFSHVIDYMNGDYKNQESTEEYTKYILSKDEYFLECIEFDELQISDIVDFKKYSVVDNNRPKLCADRIDGIILTGIGWTKNIDFEDIKNIVSNMRLFKNETGEEEIGFTDLEVVKKVLEVNQSIDLYCHTKEDNYMMQLLADITKIAISKNYISYEDLYYFDEEYLINLLKSKGDPELLEMLNKFEHIKIKDIPEFAIPEVKVRKLIPLVNEKRIII